MLSYKSYLFAFQIIMPTPNKTSQEQPKPSQKRKWLYYLFVTVPILLIINFGQDELAEIINKNFFEIAESDTLSQQPLFFPVEDTLRGIPVSIMVPIEGGTFLMGSENSDSDEWPLHEVQVSDFEIGKYEVTNEAFCAFLNENGNQEKREITWLEIESKTCLIEKRDGKFVSKLGFERHPVVEVNWHGATAYAKWLNQVSGKKGWRLLTEAEWEYAAGGGEKDRTIWAGTSKGSLLFAYAWYGSRATKKSYEVGTTPRQNSLGLCDMSGNVSEWVSDRYDTDYYAACKAKGLVKDPKVLKTYTNTFAS